MHNNIFLEIKNTKEKNKITIPKKIIKKATDRNKVKRRIKHILRSVDYSKKTSIRIKKNNISADDTQLSFERIDNKNNLNKKYSFKEFIISPHNE